MTIVFLVSVLRRLIASFKNPIHLPLGLSTWTTKVVEEHAHRLILCDFLKNTKVSPSTLHKSVTLSFSHCYISISFGTLTLLCNLSHLPANDKIYRETPTQCEGGSLKWLYKEMQYSSSFVVGEAFTTGPHRDIKLAICWLRFLVSQHFEFHRSEVWRYNHWINPRRIGFGDSSGHLSFSFYCRTCQVTMPVIYMIIVGLNTKHWIS